MESKSSAWAPDSFKNKMTEIDPFILRIFIYQLKTNLIITNSISVFSKSVSKAKYWLAYFFYAGIPLVILISIAFFDPGTTICYDLKEKFLLDNMANTSEDVARKITKEMDKSRSGINYTVYRRKNMNPYDQS